MKQWLMATAVCLAVGAVGRANLVSERWDAEGTLCTHPATLKVTRCAPAGGGSGDIGLWDGRRRSPPD